MVKNKKGQVADQFNWVFAIVAGGVILLFFFFIIGQIKLTSDAELSINVLNNFDAILTGSQVTPNTLNSIQSAKSIEYEVSCDEFGLSELTVSRSSARINLNQKIIYAPTKIQSNLIQIYTSPLKIPFNIGNSIFITQPKNLIIIHNPQVDSNLKNITELFPNNISLEESGYFQNNYKSYDYITVISNKPAPVLQFNEENNYGENILKDKNVKWIQTVFDSEGELKKAVVFYKKDKDKDFDISNPDKIDITNKEFILNLAFSPNTVFYECNYNKINKKVHTIAQIYLERVKLIEQEIDKTKCTLKYLKAIDLLEQIIISDSPLLNQQVMKDLENTNQGLLLESCPLIY